MFCAELQNFKKQLTAKIMAASELVSQHACLEVKRFFPKLPLLSFLLFITGRYTHTAHNFLKLHYNLAYLRTNLYFI